jgi:hypothetical protein
MKKKKTPTIETQIIIVQPTTADEFECSIEAQAVAEPFSISIRAICDLHKHSFSSSRLAGIPARRKKERKRVRR